MSWKRHITRKATYHTVWSVDSVFLCGRLPGCLVVSPRPHHVWPSVPIPQYSLATRGLWFCPTSRRMQAPRTALQCFANQVWPPISSWSSLWYSTLYSTVEPADCNNLQACRMIFTAGKNRSALEESQWWTGVAGNQYKRGSNFCDFKSPIIHGNIPCFCRMISIFLVAWIHQRRHPEILATVYKPSLMD